MDRPECSECERPINPGQDGVWYRPFADTTPDDDIVVSLQDQLSTSDNGGLPFHRACFDKWINENSE